MDDLLKILLEIPEETQTIEFKRLQGKKVVSKILETIVAFANTDGGNLIIGIDDPEKTKLKGEERIFGIEENKELFDEIIHSLKNIIPSLPLSDPLLLKHKDKTVAFLKIPKSTEEFLSIDGKVFVRLHKSNKKLTPQEIIKLSYAKGFQKADKELVDVDFELLDTDFYEDWRKERKIEKDKIENVLYSVGLARKNKKEVLKPTRTAVMLFAKYPTNLMDTKCTIRVYKYKGTIEKFQETPNLIATPKTIDGPIIELIKKAHEYILSQLESGIEMHSGFVTKYKIPSRAVKEAITNAVIHRDYHTKRDIEVMIFEDRIEILSPGLFSYNITKSNIGKVRAEGYKNDLLVKHLREFPDPPNLDRNEGVRAMRSEMREKNLFPPLFITYPTLDDSVKVILWNEELPSEWEKVNQYLEKNKFINNEKARNITGIRQRDIMSKKLKKWTEQGLLEKIDNPAPRYIKYKLPTKDI